LYLGTTQEYQRHKFKTRVSTAKQISKVVAQQGSFACQSLSRRNGRKGRMEQTTPKEHHHNPNNQILRLTYIYIVYLELQEELVVCLLGSGTGWMAG
jgi:hypothetical protein